MMTPDKPKELEDIIIDFNECLEIVLVGLEQLKTGVQAIVDNLQTEINELSTGTLSTISTTSPAKPQTSPTTQTTEPSSSSPFLEKEKEMLELKVKPLSKKIYI